jgi:hypothetical protein
MHYIVFLFSICFTIIIYIVIWLTVECSYILFISKFFITFVAWFTISPKLTCYFELLILKNESQISKKENPTESLSRHKSTSQLYSKNDEKRDRSSISHLKRISSLSLLVDEKI